MKKNHNLFFIICIIVLTILMGIGYATVNNTTLTITGLSGAAENGIIKITNVELKEKTDNVTASNPVWSEDSTEVSFNVSFTLEEDDPTAADEHSATYEVTLLNDTISEYSFGSDLFSPTLTITPPAGETLEYVYEVNGVQVGDIIPAKTSVTFTVKLTLYPSGGAGDYSGGVQAEVGTEEEIVGILIGTFKNNNSSGDLTGNHTTAPLTISVMNTFDSQKSFSFSVSNSNFSVVDNNGNSNQTYQINANTESQDFVIYIKRKNGVTFGNSPQRFNLYMTSSEGTISIGTVSMAVDVDPNFYDNQAPTIGSLTATKVSSQKNINVTWTATDNYGIDHYNVYAYNNSNQLVSSATNITDTTHTFTNLSNGTYHFKVEAFDGKGNHSERSTSNTTYSWTYTVRVTTCTNCSGSPSTQTVDAGGSVTVTLTGNSGYNNNPPTINSVIMTDSVSNEQINLNGSYTYQNNVLSISNITGDVAISAAGVDNGCLVKGTKILLANGKTKNIEDINYDDLLAVWNYNDGTITYEYPLWIEKEHKTNSFIRITFNDNTHIDIVENHAFYSMDHNKFINIHDKEFKVGLNIAKLNNNKLSKVKITSIKTINKDINYYFVGSTTYYNIIANNILTTDGKTMISNLYGFKDNAIWPSNKDKLVNDNELDYSYFKDVLPYYIYKGFRVKEAGYLINYNFVSLNDFKDYIISYITSEQYIRKPITDFNKNNNWMVTTNLDIINDFNKKDYLYKEGSIYTLPKNNTIKKWYSTSENKYYKPGDKVQVWHGMHFIAINK